MAAAPARSTPARCAAGPGGRQEAGTSRTRTARACAPHGTHDHWGRAMEPEPCPDHTSVLGHIWDTLWLNSVSGLRKSADLQALRKPPSGFEPLTPSLRVKCSTS